MGIRLRTGIGVVRESAARIDVREGNKKGCPRTDTLFAIQPIQAYFFTMVRNTVSSTFTGYLRRSSAFHSFSR